MENKFTEIKGFRRQVFLPRQGKIRLGKRLISKKTGKEYSSETDYFVCPPEVEKVYGKQPKTIDIMFPSENQAEVIPYCYKQYGSNNKLKCKGNGENALRFNFETKSMEEISCPCSFLEKRECQKKGHLMVLVYKVSLGGVYQIDTGSTANINRILDAIEYWKAMVGRCKFIPLTLSRVPEKLPDPQTGHMNTHYLFQFGAKIALEDMNILLENKNKIITVDYKIATPKENGVEHDTPVEYIEEENRSNNNQSQNGQQNGQQAVTMQDLLKLKQKVGEGRYKEILAKHGYCQSAEQIEKAYQELANGWTKENSLDEQKKQTDTVQNGNKENIRDKFYRELSDYCEGDEKLMESHLREISTIEGTDKCISTLSGIKIVSENWLRVCLGKLRKRVKESVDIV